MIINCNLTKIIKIVDECICELCLHIYLFVSAHTFYYYYYYFNSFDFSIEHDVCDRWAGVEIALFAVPITVKNIYIPKVILLLYTFSSYTIYKGKKKKKKMVKYKFRSVVYASISKVKSMKYFQAPETS